MLQDIGPKPMTGSIGRAPRQHRSNHAAADVASAQLRLGPAWVAAVILTLGVLLIALKPERGFSQAVQLVRVDLSVVAKGYRASQMIGSSVTNDKNEKIGSLDDIVVGTDHQVLFAVLQVGGFLGLGGHLVVVPYESLKIDDSGRKIVLPGASKEELSKLSEYKYQS